MPAVRTDYMTPYSRMGQALGGSVQQAGATVGSAIANAPQQAATLRGQELKNQKSELDLEQFKQNKEYRIGIIDGMKEDFQKFAKNHTNMNPKQYDQINSYFDNLKKAPATTAEKKLDNISTYLTNYANRIVTAQETKDPLLSDMVDFEQAITPAAWDSKAELDSMNEQWKTIVSKRKQGAINDLLKSYVEENPNADQEKANGAILTRAQSVPLLKGVEADTILKATEKFWESRKDIQNRNQAQQKINIDRTRQQQGDKPKNNATDYSRVKSQFDKLTKDYTMEDVRAEPDLARKVVINLETQRIMQDGVTPWTTADEKAKAAVANLNYAQVEDLMTKLTWKPDQPAEAKGGIGKFFSDLGGMIKSVASSSVEPESIAASARQPGGQTAAPAPQPQANGRQPMQGSAGAGGTETDEQRRARLRATLKQQRKQ